MRAAVEICQFLQAHARSANAHQAASGEEANLCALELELCKGGFATGDGPDLTAIAHNGLHKGIKQLALDNGVMYVQLLTLPQQTKHSSLGCLTKGLYGMLRDRVCHAW